MQGQYMNMKPNQVCNPYRTSLKSTFAGYLHILRKAHKHIT